MEEKMTNTYTMPLASEGNEAMLARLDAIIRELQDLRRALLTQQSSSPSAPMLTQRLWGSLAPPTHNSTRDILEEYHAVSDWERFA